MNIPKAQFQCKMQPMLRVKQGGIVRSVPTPTEDVTGATINTGGWQTVVGTFSAVALVEGCKGFLSVVLKRWFPLHHPEIDLWFQRLDSALNLAGIVSLGCTIAVGGWSALPIVAISGFTGFITSWIFRKFGIGENVAQFVFYLKDLIFYYVSQLLRLAGAPSGIAEMFWKETAMAYQVKVGKCLNCEKRPRTVISERCHHMAYCAACSVLVSYCPCGDAMGKRNRTIVRVPVTCKLSCVECVQLPKCSVCLKRATHLISYASGKATNRCSDHIDSTADFQITFPFLESSCNSKRD